MRQLSKSQPLQVAIVFTSIIFLLRILDVFVIRSDELFGEQVVTKVFGLIVIVVYVWNVQGDLARIGLTGKNWQTSVMLGLFIMSVGLAIGYSVEWLYLYGQGLHPEIYVRAQGNTLIPEDVATGGLVFALTLLIGNIINSFMEEGLFRGILMTHLGSRMNLFKANLIQSIVFGVWHIVWPLRDYLDGGTTLVTAVGISAGYILLSGLIGFAWGFFYQKTNSLWTSWAAHTLNNTVINFVHVTTSAGIPATLGLRVGVSTLMVILLLPVVNSITKARALEELQVWS